MSFSQLPPQAYTRDMLAQAYEWLHQQPPNVQELATNADTLVSLFMQSRRRIGQPLTAASQVSLNQDSIMGPVSAETFKNDLKSLAEGFRQFDSPRATTPAPVATTTANQAAAPAAPSNLPTPSMPAPNREHMLDQRSADVVREVQRKMNLSSEQEAIRLLLAVGYDRIRQVLPESSHDSFKRPL